MAILIYHTRHLCIMQDAWECILCKPQKRQNHRKAQAIYKVNFILDQNLIPCFLTPSTGSFCLSFSDPKDRETGKENKDCKP